jgi:hypothetical protein
VRDEPFPLRDPADDATETFIPQIQVDAAVAAKPHKTQKLDRSVEAVAKKLASVQGQSS